MSKDFIYFDKKLSRNKCLSIQLSHFGVGNIFSLVLTISRKQSHPGVYFDFTLLGLSFIVNFYDRRHWDHEKNCLVDYDD